MSTESPESDEQAQTIQVLRELLAKARAGEIERLEACIRTHDGQEQLIIAGPPGPPCTRH